VYVLRSQRTPERHYVGLTTDVNGRLERHNAGINRYTNGDRPRRMVLTLEFAGADLAARFERYLKSGSGRAFAKRNFV
jgi:predicted GIY-YIG superfamily endonuclease